MARKVKVVKKKKKNKKKNFLYYAVMAVLVCIIAVSGYQLYGILMNYLQGRNKYLRSTGRHPNVLLKQKPRFLVHKSVSFRRITA